MPIFNFSSRTVGEIDSRELRKGGFLYEQAIEQDPYLVDGKIYELPNCLYLKYDIDSDVLSPVEEKCHPRVRFYGLWTINYRVSL